MSGSALVNVMPPQHLLAGGDGGGDDPANPSNNLKSSHELNAAAVVTPSRRKKKAAGGGSEGQFPCPVCGQRFDKQKAIHGHMRSHPERGWRGMEPPRSRQLGADGKYACGHCGAQYEKRQALGGHRASHSSKKGCSWHSKQQPAEERRPVLPFDLNEPLP